MRTLRRPSGDDRVAPRRAVSGSARATYAGTSATSGAVGTTNGQVMSALRVRGRGALPSSVAPRRAGWSSSGRSCRGRRRPPPAGAVAPWLGRHGPAPGRGRRATRRSSPRTRPAPSSAGCASSAPAQPPRSTADHDGEHRDTGERAAGDQAGDRSTCGQPAPPDAEQRAAGRTSRPRPRRPARPRAPPASPWPTSVSTSGARRGEHDCRCGSAVTPSSGG